MFYFYSKWQFDSGSRGYTIRNAASGSYLSFGKNEQPGEGVLLTGNNNPVEWEVRQSDQGYQ